jgi:hypothetical protein
MEAEAHTLTATYYGGPNPNGLGMITSFRTWKKNTSTDGNNMIPTYVHY